jgi:translocation and assembly module TamB
LNTRTPIVPESHQDPPQAKYHRSLRVASRILIGMIATVIVFVAVSALVIRTKRFHSYLLSTARTQASQRLGVQVELQDFALHLSTLSLDLYGLTVHGAEPYSEPPLLQVAHAEAGVRVVSILHRKWYLDSFQIDRPVVRIYSDAKGDSNIPKLRSSGGSSNTNLFDLGIRHATLTNGQVFYNDKQSDLSADLNDVEFRAGFNVLLEKYSGTIRYADGHLTTNTLRTFAHGLSAEFDATPSAFHLTNAKLTTGRSQALLSATLENFADPDVQASYDVTIEGDDIRQILGNDSVPLGVVRASGSAHYHALPNRPLLDEIVIHGTLSSPQLEVQTPSLRARITDVAAEYSLSNGGASVPALQAHLLGGELKAAATIRAIGGDSHTQAKATLRGISLGTLREMLRTLPVPKNVGLGGELNAQLDATWGKTLDDLVAHADATIDGRVFDASSSRATSTMMPLKGVIHGGYTAAEQEIVLKQSYVRLPQTNLTLNGVMSKHSNVALRFHSDDMHELETVANILRTPIPGQPTQPLGLGGIATFNGNLGGSTAQPHLAGQLVATNVHVRGTEWRTVRTNVILSPSQASLQDAHLDPASQGRIIFSASVGLTKWSLTNTSPIQLDLDASQLDVSDLTKAFGLQIPLTGILAAKLKLQGSKLRPIGQGHVSLTRVVAYDEAVHSAEVDFSGNGDELHGNLAVSMPAGNLQGTVSFMPQQKTYTAQLTAKDFRIEKLQVAKARNLDARGAIQLKANGQGTFDNPQLDATVQIAQLEVQKQTVGGLDLRVNLANHVATANLSSKAINTSINGTARVNLTGDYVAEASLDTQAIPLQPLVAIYAPEQAADLTGETELHATLHGPLKNKRLLEAHIRIPVLKLGYSNTVQLAAVSPILIDYKNNFVSVQRGSIRGTDTDLQFQGSIPTAGQAPISLLLVGTVKLHLMELFQPDLRSSGQLKFNINSYGATRDPNVQGQVEIVDANIANGDLPVGLQHGNGVLTLTKDRLNISKFQAVVGSGTVTAQGGIAYRPNVQFDLGLSARDVRVLYPQGVREGVNADIRLAGTTENAVLGGTINISELSFTPAFDLTRFINQFTGGVTAPPSQGLTQNIQLNLSVHSSNNINLVSRTLSVNGTANLQVRGTAAQPVILGRINLDSGDLIFNGDRFVLNGGTVQFVNPSETEPVVNLSLNTNIQQYSIFMRFNGPIDQLRTDYASDPSLPAADIINLLAFGKTTEANSPDAATPANQAAETLVASQVSSQITSRVSKIAGISQLSIDPVLAGGSSQGPPGANITIQQRVTGNLFVTFSTNVASTQNQTIMGQYQVSPRVALSATRDQNGGFAIDATIKKTW